MTAEEFNYTSLMGVLKATEEVDGGIRVPGHLMPKGRPVISKGVKVADLMKDRGMAEGWYNAVRQDYERQEEERDRPAGEPDVPDLVIGGKDPAPRQSRRDGSPTPETGEDFEVTLQKRRAYVRSRIPQLEQELRQLLKEEAGLDAYFSEMENDSE
jgi:hypothetical protein